MESTTTISDRLPNAFPLVARLNLPTPIPTNNTKSSASASNTKTLPGSNINRTTNSYDNLYNPINSNYSYSCYEEQESLEPEGWNVEEEEEGGGLLGEENHHDFLGKGNTQYQLNTSR